MSDNSTVGIVDQDLAGSANTKDVAVRTVTFVSDDGSLVTANMQVVSLADADGHAVDLNNGGLLTEIRDLLREIRDDLAIKGGIL